MYFLVAEAVVKEQLPDVLLLVVQVVAVKVLKDQILETQEQEQQTLAVAVVAVEKDLHQKLVELVVQELSL